MFFAPCKKVAQSKRDQKQEKSPENEEDEYLSDGRKKSVRKEVDELPEVKAFQIDNIH